MVRYGSDEAIPLAPHGLNKGRTLGGVAESIPQFADRGIQSFIELDEGIGWPELLSQLVAGHQLSGVLQQDPEDLKWFFLNVNRDPALE
jgi:hypothetical protein